MSLLLLLAGAGITAPRVTGVYLVPVDGGQYVQWTAFDGALGYRIYYSRGTTLVDPLYVSGSDTSKMISGLENWADYAFAVAAIVAGPIETGLSLTVVGKPGVLDLHPFGVMVSALNYPYTTFALRGAMYRQGTGVKLAETTLENEVAIVKGIAADLAWPLRLWLTCRWNGGGGHPDTGPIGATELATWAANLAEYVARYDPYAVAVLNEEPSVTFSTLTSAQYLAVLDESWNVLNPLGIKVTNGGVVWTGAALCYWDHLFNDVGLAEAAAFASIAFREPERTTLMECVDETTLDPAYLTAISKNKDWLYNVYTTDYMDFMNIHVHWPELSAGLEAIRQVMVWYGEVSGKVVVTNESNTASTDIDLLLALNDLYRALGLPMVIQYSINSGHSTALQDTDGSLFATGEAWRDDMIAFQFTVRDVTPFTFSGALSLSAHAPAMLIYNAGAVLVVDGLSDALTLFNAPNVLEVAA